MSIKSLIAKFALLLSAPFFCLPAAFADQAWADYNPSTGQTSFGYNSFQPGPNIVPHPYFYPQGPQMPNTQMPGMQGGGMAGMPGMGGQQGGRYMKQSNLPPARYATMALTVTSEGDENAQYFGQTPSLGGSMTPPPVDMTRPISDEPTILDANLPFAS